MSFPRRLDSSQAGQYVARDFEAGQKPCIQREKDTPLARGKEPGSAGTAKPVQSASQPPVSDELDNRRKRLEAKLAEKGVGDKSDSVENESGKNAGVAQAMKLSSEFIAGVLAGAGLGWLIDRFAGTSPWGLIVFLLLGFCAGTLNILRSAGYVAENDGFESGKGSDHKDKH